MSFDGSAIFGGDRSKRYALVVKGGKVASVAVEPDNTGTSVSMAEKVLGASQAIDWNA
jgi:2-Cys peroxiredoxin 5